MHTYSVERRLLYVQVNQFNAYYTRYIYYRQRIKVFTEANAIIYDVYQEFNLGGPLI